MCKAERIKYINLPLRCSEPKEGSEEAWKVGSWGAGEAKMKQLALLKVVPMLYSALKSPEISKNDAWLPPLAFTT